jgi:ABC-type glycerol-3-phosphate transport system substrate-binding protein
MALSRRDLLRFGGAAAAGGLLAPGLAACGQGPQAPIKSGSVDVNLWTNDQNYVNLFTWWAKRLSTPSATYRYNLHPLVQDSEVVATKTLSAYTAHSHPPELPGIEISQFSRFMKAGIAPTVFVDLTDRIAGVRDQFFTSRWAPYQVDGRQYGVESSFPLAVYYYRADLFEKYKIPVELDTWDDVLKVGKQVNDKHGVSLGVVGIPQGGDLTWLGILLQQRGGQFFDKDGNLTIDSRETVDAIQLMVDGVKSGAFLMVSDFYGGPGTAAIKQGKGAAFFMPDWFESFILRSTAPELSGKWRMRPLPRFAGGGHPTSVWGGTGFCVSKDMPGTDATWDLLQKVYLTEEGQVERFKRIHFLPTMKKAWDNKELIDFTDPYLGGQHSFRLFKSLSNDAPTQYQSPYWNIMTVELSIALEDALTGRKTAAQAVKSATASITSQMK